MDRDEASSELQLHSFVMASTWTQMSSTALKNCNTETKWQMLDSLL